MSVGYLKKCSSRGKPKKSHISQAVAEAHRSAMIATGKWAPGGSNTYYCHQCGGWHAGSLGTSNRGKGRRVAAKNAPRRLDTQ